jgi:hypothetical protein
LHKHLLRKKKSSQQHQPLQQVLQHQLKLKLRRTKRSLQKVSLQRKTHLKQTQSQPLLQRSKFDLEDSDLIIDDEITFGRNRQAENFGKVVEEELSDYVKFRLWLARQIALAKYREAHG